MSDAILRRTIADLESRLRRLEAAQSSRRPHRERDLYRPCVIRIHNDVTSAGTTSLHKYVCVVLSGESTAKLAGDLAMPEGLFEPDEDYPGLAIDVSADGGAENLISEFPTYRVGIVVGRLAEERGRTAGGGWIVAFSGGGGSLPPPTQKYQVYTPIDDTLKPTWTTARFQ